MTEIRCVYQVEPGFPALDQHPAAVRYQVGGYWVDAVGDPPTLAGVEALLLVERRAAAWERIKAHRDELSNTGGYKVVVGGVDKWFHSDAKSKIQQLGLVLAGAAVPAVQWKTMDGTFVTMSQALADQIYQAAMTQDSTIYQVAENHRVAMEAAPDPDAYDFSGGWPATFTPVA